MKIMTSNIWGDFFGNEVSGRDEQLYQVYKKYDPDIIGLQEATGAWYLSNLFRQLEQDGYLFLGAHYVHPDCYTSVPGQSLYEGGISVPMLIKKECFSVEEYGYEQLRNTPDRSKAITWAVLKKKADGKVFGVCNTHFWWMSGKESEEDKVQLERVIGASARWSKEAHDALRVENAEQLAARMKYIRDKYDCAVFAFGDMNTHLDSEVFDVYRSNQIKCLQDEARTASEVSSWHGNPQRGADGHYHGARTQKGREGSIDHMVGMTEKYEVAAYVVVEDQEALDATDHSPVYAELTLL